MKKTTFFAITVVIVLAMTIVYTVQLSSLANKQCKAYKSFECEVLFLSNCIGDDIWGFELEYSFCDVGTCIGLYSGFCVNINGIQYMEMECADSTNQDCAGW